MRYVHLPHSATPRQLPFYLAAEEYVARQLPPAEYFFLWQVRPSVIFGRNQVAQREVNIAYCRQQGIDMWRRKSGGGCVYADMGNIMLSYITPGEQVRLTFNHYVSLLALVLGKMGIEAKPTGRNDVLIDGRKVSGNAFFHLPGRSIVHGTLLYDTCMEHMTAAITPPQQKLESKGVSSVRQHITTLREHTALSIEEVKALIKTTLCRDSIELTPADVAQIEAIEADYHLPDFIFGLNPRYNVTRQARLEGVGDIEVSLAVKGNVIEDVNMVGDFFLTGDIEQQLIQPLRGCPLTPEALHNALPDDIGDTIMNMKKQQLIDIILQ